jgi:hypothetical protein
VKTTDKNGKVTKKIRKVVVKRGKNGARIKTIKEKVCDGKCDSNVTEYTLVDGPFTLPPAQDCGVLHKQEIAIPPMTFDIKKHRALNYPCNKKNAKNPYGNPNLIREIRQYLNMESELAGSGCASYCDIKKVKISGDVDGEGDLADVVPPKWCEKGGRLATAFKKEIGACGCKSDPEANYTKGCAKCTASLTVKLGTCYNRDGSKGPKRKE